jgi:hypothetical protein
MGEINPKIEVFAALGTFFLDVLDRPHIWWS